jgi:hypothetical protein
LFKMIIISSAGAGDYGMNEDENKNIKVGI